MIINLEKLSYKDKIEINEVISFADSALENSSIKKLQNIKVNGFISQNEIDQYVIKLHVKGEMELLDSISLEPISYPLDFTIDKIIDDEMQNKQNTLDIMELLWQNIVLEVPIRYTKSDAQNLKGDNWQVIDDSQDENKIDPRMAKLYEYNKGGE